LRQQPDSKRHLSCPRIDTEPNSVLLTFGSVGSPRLMLSRPDPRQLERREARRLSWRSRHVPWDTLFVGTLLLIAVLVAIYAVIAEGLPIPSPRREKPRPKRLNKTKQERAHEVLRRTAARAVESHGQTVGRRFLWPTLLYPSSLASLHR
jgi:hypothetical protein